MVVGYLAAGRVISYFYSRVTADVETNGNGFAIIPLIIGRGAIGIFGLIAAVFVFVAIVGVGGAVLSQAWTRLAPMILDRCWPRSETR